MSLFTPVSDQLVMLSHLNSTPIDTSAIKSFCFSDHPLIKIDIYEDNTWGIHAPEIHLNCLNEDVLEPVFQWGDAQILFSTDGHVHVSSEVINLGDAGKDLLSIRFDLIREHI